MPFCIPKRWVWDAYKRVKTNRGAAGVDEQSVEQFEANVKGNLYKLWNRLSSGSYFPPPVKRVDIAKRDGGTRPLGIPTVADRIAQAVVKAYLEPGLEQQFHPDSYGYRPKKSAVEAVGVARKRSWRYAWVLDLDIRAYFDTIPHELLVKAVKQHTDCAWVLLYIGRWLTAPVRLADGTLEPRTQGTPQGSVVSPLLANFRAPDMPFGPRRNDGVRLSLLSGAKDPKRGLQELKRRRKHLTFTPKYAEYITGRIMASQVIHGTSIPHALPSQSRGHGQRAPCRGSAGRTGHLL